MTKSPVIAAIALLFGLVVVAYQRQAGLLIETEVMQVEQGEASYFLKRCRYLTLRGVFVQVAAEESRWRLERVTCSRFLV